MKRVAVVLIVALGAVGCGHASGVSKQASAQLAASVQRIRAAAVTQDRAAADRALAELRGRVAELRTSGEVSRSAATRILDAATRVQSELTAIPTTTTPSTTTTTAPPPTTSDTCDRKCNQEERKKGRGD